MRNVLTSIQSQYHPYCPVDYSNVTSEQNCWLGDTKVPLPDLNTQDSTVISGYSTWIKSLVETYNIDGLRIDAAKFVSCCIIGFGNLTNANNRHVDPAFWPQFCGAAGVYCIGEVFGDDIEYVPLYACNHRILTFVISFASTWQGPLDAILQYPMYNALVEAFAIPGPQNMSAMTDMIAQSKQKFKVWLLTFRGN